MTDEQNPVDLSIVMANSMGDEEFVREMVQIFIEQNDTQIPVLKTLCTDGENKEWVEVAHLLKGAAAMIGAENLRKLYAQAQKTDPGTATQREELVAQIEPEYRHARAFLVEKGYVGVI